ncbi:hypothetical protein MPSEU_000073400 [Mayamaea pseudoterrestris]|nr:hypothetical protein MPSEU_000073400 [Mayamaea pseudoterrestris]
MKSPPAALDDSNVSYDSLGVASTAVCDDRQRQTAANGLLMDHPNLITYHILCMSLKHRPFFSAVRHMLNMNPKAANVPKEGQSALQVAVQYNCSIDIVELLIAANPMALVVTDPETSLDPLAYAKRYRLDDGDLIELLSWPVSHWLNDANGDKEEDGMPSSCKDKENACPSLSESQLRQQLHSPQRAVSKEVRFARQELNNVKALCTSAVKGQKLETLSFEDYFQKLEKRNEKLAQDQRNALDMMEQAMVTHMTWLEQRFETAIEEKLKADCANDELHHVMGRMETELRLVQGRLACLELDMAQTVYKLGSLHDCQGLETSRSNVSGRQHVRKGRVVTPSPTPVVFCSRPNKTPKILDDDVRSLLSEDEIVPRGRQLCLKASKQVSPLARMAVLFKEGILAQ